MQRTRRRPLPDGRLQPGEAAVFGATADRRGDRVPRALGGAGCAAVIAVIAVLYLGVYTPLKRVSPLATVLGAIPGALPPVAGWVAARGELGIGAAVLFAILFLWQLPHTLAIARLYREDYARAGIRVLPVVDPGRRQHRAADRRRLPGAPRGRPAPDPRGAHRRHLLLRRSPPGRAVPGRRHGTGAAALGAGRPAGRASPRSSTCRSCWRSWRWTRRASPWRTRAPEVRPVAPGPGLAAAGSLPARNRRTAIGLVAWIVTLMLASALVAWFRN